jgi:hypothetical protein
MVKQPPNLESKFSKWVEEDKKKKEVKAYILCPSCGFVFLLFLSIFVELLVFVVSLIIQREIKADKARKAQYLKEVRCLFVEIMSVYL